VQCNLGQKKNATKKIGHRRSARKSQQQIKNEDQAILALQLGGSPGRDINAPFLRVRRNPKGRGVYTKRAFEQGEFVLEYAGELVDSDEAKKREQQYSLDSGKGSYMYYFKINGRSLCVDATEEPQKQRLGRLVNHGRLNANLRTKAVVVNKEPRLILLAKSDIPVGAELLFNYGDTGKATVKAFPWLRK